MAEKYTPEDLMRFATKDAAIVLQNALRHATGIVANHGPSSHTVEDAVANVKQIAVNLARWVYAEADKLAAEQLHEPSKPSPAPTPEQSAILAKCLAKYDKLKPAGTVVSFEKLQKAVWERYHVYAQRDESVSKIIGDIPIEAILEKVQ
jgi:hypothetical protein